MDTYALGLGVALSPLHAVAAWTPMDTYGSGAALLPLHAVAAWTPMDTYGHLWICLLYTSPSPRDRG